MLATYTNPFPETSIPGMFKKKITAGKILQTTNCDVLATSFTSNGGEKKI